MTPICMFDYLEHYRELEGEIGDAVRSVFESGQLILGPAVSRFEEAFTDYLAPSGESIGVGNGTDAIAIALRAIEVGAGDEVITVSNTAVPTVSAIRETGARPVFCDVDPETGLMDLDLVSARFTKRTRAIVAVHLFGNAVDIPRLELLCKGRPISIVEDCAQAHGARLRGAMVGTMGSVSTFSFYPTKNLGAFGDGGLCFTRDASLAARIRSLRMYGFEDLYYSEREGVNSRLDEVQAAILSVKLRYLSRQVERRRAIAKCYDEILEGRVACMRAGREVDHAYHLYVVRVRERDRVRSAMKHAGVATGVHYPFPIHRMRAYEFLDYPVGSLPVTERLSEQVLSLPMYPELPVESARYVAEALVKSLD